MDSRSCLINSAVRIPRRLHNWKQLIPELCTLADSRTAGTPEGF